MGTPKQGSVLCFRKGDRRDNRKCNLRKLTRRQRNLLPLCKRKPNDNTGVVGVSCYSDGPYVVAEGPGNKRKSFRNKEQAIATKMAFEKYINIGV
jgi:hypothetical protein